MAKSETVQLLVFVHAETGKALLVSDNEDEGDAVWLPKSQITEDRDRSASSKKPNVRAIVIPEWLALKHEFI